MWWPYSSPSVATSVNVACPSGSASPADGRARCSTNRADVGGRARLEAHRGRQRAVVEGDDDVPIGAQLDAVEAAGYRGRWSPPARAPGSCSARRPRRAMRSVSRSTAVSGSQRPLGRWPKRSSASRRPQRISVRRSRAAASGRMAWWKACAMTPVTGDPGRRWRHASPGARGAASGPSVGPRSKPMRAKLPAAAFGP